MEGQTTEPSTQIENNTQALDSMPKPKLKRGRRAGVKFPNGYKKKSELHTPEQTKEGCVQEAPAQETKV